MFDNCKSCLFYDKEDDSLGRMLNDEIIIDDPNPDKHFCDMWDEEWKVIPKDVWEHRTQCPYYVKA